MPPSLGNWDWRHASKHHEWRRRGCARQASEQCLSDWAFLGRAHPEGLPIGVAYRKGLGPFLLARTPNDVKREQENRDKIWEGGFMSELLEVKAKIEEAIEAAEDSPVRCVNLLWRLLGSFGGLTMNEALEEYAKERNKRMLDDQNRRLHRANDLEIENGELRDEIKALKRERRDIDSAAALVIQNPGLPWADIFEKLRKKLARKKVKKDMWTEALAKEIQARCTEVPV
jgi:hypothetical protein